MKKEKEIYLKRECDQIFASLLKSKGYRLHDVEWEGNVAYWIFEDSKHEADSLIQSFINGEVTGNLKEFVDSQKILKQIIFRNKK